MAGINSHRAILSVGARQARSAERLSSGMRINRAADDAAGLAISERMRNQLRGVNQAERNSQDGISLLQTAEGAMEEIHRILERVRVLTNQASNDVITSEDRMLIYKEVDQILQEIDHIALNTEFNTLPILQGDPWGGPAVEPIRRQLMQVLASGGDITTMIPGLDFSANLQLPGQAGYQGAANALAIQNWINSLMPTNLGPPDYIWEDALTPLTFPNAGEFPYGWALNDRLVGMSIRNPEIFATEAGVSKFIMEMLDETFFTFDHSLTEEQARAYNALALADFFTFVQTMLEDIPAGNAWAGSPADPSLWDVLMQRLQDDSPWLLDVMATPGFNPSTRDGSDGIDLTGAPTTAAELNEWFEALKSEIMVLATNAVNAASGILAADVPMASAVAAASNALAVADAARNLAHQHALEGEDIIDDFLAEVDDMYTSSELIDLLNRLRLEGSSHLSQSAISNAALLSSLESSANAVNNAITQATAMYRRASQAADDLDTAGEDSSAIRAELIALQNEIDTARDEHRDLLLAISNTPVVTGGLVIPAAPSLANIVRLEMAENDLLLAQTAVNQNPTPANLAAHAAALAERDALLADARADVSALIDINSRNQMQNAVTITAPGGVLTNAIQTATGIAANIDTLRDRLTQLQGEVATSSDALLQSITPAMQNVFQLQNRLDSFFTSTAARFLGANFGAVDGERQNPINSLNLEIQTGANSLQRTGVELKAMGLRQLRLENFADDFELAALDDVTTGGRTLSLMLEELDAAINFVSEQRATLGAVQNRLEHTINNLQVAGENIAASNSRIRDTDMALEVMNNTQANVLAQAGMSMLAQANTTAEAILQLL